jgi:glycine/D-amino acid oxidase-like deaminating enzyme
VIVAAGPWTPEVIDPTGTWRPIRPIWGVVVAATLPAPPRHVLEEADISTEPGMDGAGGADGDDGATHDAGVEFSLMTAGGTSSLGSTFLADAPDPADLVPAIVERGARFIPAIATARLGAHRRCARPVSLDGRPLIGVVPGSVGLWIAAGHGPWGISTGPASGRLLADLVAGRRSRPPAVFDPDRFERPPP